jgi:integrase
MTTTNHGGILSQRRGERLEPTTDGFRFRPRFGKLGRHWITICTSNEPLAEKRRDEITDIARMLVAAGHADQAVAMAKKAGSSPDAETIRELHSIAEGLCKGRVPKRKADGATLTFQQVAKKWTSGELHRDHPDHVKDKDHTDDKSRLEKLCAIDLGRGTLGSVPIGAFTLDHAETAMRHLPPEAKRPATRRGYAQVIHRVLALAVYPCRYIATNPLPKGFMPKVGKPPAHSYLYPAEDAALMACIGTKEKPGVPLAYRLLYGFLAREGCRLGEALALRWQDVDLDLGVLKLDANKTDDARAWQMDPGVVRALKAWKRIVGDGFQFVFVHGEGILGKDQLAERLRADLLTAKVDRAELHKDGENRGKFRVHDLRGTFVTLSLANGKTETWVADRTGHTSSQMSTATGARPGTPQN